jgi:Holliday junction resolvasome RuvABC endonuclease subunit
MEERKLHMGVDQSFTSTGICILDEELNLVFHTKCSTDKVDGIFDRAIQMSQMVHDLVEKWQPVDFTIEGLAMNSMSSSSKDLAGLQFCMITDIMVSFPHIPVKIFTPGQVKKAATTKVRGVKKEAMFEALPENIKEEIGDNYLKTKGRYDVTDAYWLTYLGIKGAEWLNV